MEALRPVALVGPMGAGKSAVARMLGARLSTTVADLDSRIESAAGRSVAELFGAGEAAFRALETAALRRAIEDGAGVIACGGGIVLRPENRVLLRERCRTVWLDVAGAEAARRVRGEASVRPLLGDGPLEPRLEQLRHERMAGYAEVAVARVDTTGKDSTRVVELVLESLEIIRS